jgi:alpha-2-macroglobulin-like protein
MGPALNNLENLVQQPTGCGEQNMVKFAPIVSVVKYLTETNQMTDKINEQTKEFLKIGKI